MKKGVAMCRARTPLLSAVVLLLAAHLPGTAGKDEPAGIKVDKDKRTVTIDAKIAPRKLEYLKGEVYPIEVIACWPHPKGKKAHETVVTIDVMPSAVHKALESLGLRAGKPVMGESDTPAQGPEVKVYIEVPDVAGEVRRVPIERALVDMKTGKQPKKLEWRFTGSALKQPDPNKADKAYGADLSGTLMVIFPVSDETVLQTSLSMKEEKYLKLETNTKLLPKEGTPVKLVLEVPAAK
jgi:hypothetical protein